MLVAALPEGAVPLAVGTVLALVGLSLVLAPLLGNGSPPPLPTRRSPDAAREPEDGAVAALREIEFDRETGKLSDSDYIELKTRYTRAAIEELRAADQRLSHTALPTMTETPMPETNAIEHDPVEAAIQRARARQRSCARCGPRVEPDATYCSTCGSFLPGSCPHCGRAVTESSACYCAACGTRLLAA